MIDDTILLPIVCIVCITAVYGASVALTKLLKMSRAPLAVPCPTMTRGILRKPQYSNNIKQEDLDFVSPQSIDEANELWDSFASYKSTPSASVETRGILRKPQYLNNIKCVEGTEQFFPGEFHHPASQCLCLNAGLCRAHSVPAAKRAQLSWIFAGHNSNQ